LFGVCCSFDSIPLILIIAMACGSKEGESYVFTHLLVVMLNPCMLVPSRPCRLFGSCDDNRTTKNTGDVLVHLVHLGHGTLQVIWALMFFCMSLLSMPRLLPWRAYWKYTTSLIFSSRSTLSWFSSSIMAYRLRENGTSPACSLFSSRQSP
jgi:hypothetical protein